MRTTVTETFGSDFFKIFTRNPGNITLTLKRGEVVKGVNSNWAIFVDYITLIDRHTLGNFANPYDEIESYSVEVDAGRPFGRFLVRENETEDWSDWLQRCDIQYFIDRLLAGDTVKFSLEVPAEEPDVFVEGKIHSVTAETITLAGGAVRVDRNKIVWVSQRLT